MPSIGKKAVEKRILEAEKVVVSNILNNWRTRWGMDYVIVVRNSPGSVFARTRVGDEGTEDMVRALEAELKALKA